MKVFGCKRQGNYSGGIVLVAANSIEEAFNVASHSNELEYMFEWTDKHGFWADSNDKDAVCSSSYYPFEKWEEYNHLSCDFTEPCVIVEAGYSE